MMRKDARWLMALAALLLVPVYYLPLWSIRLVAPQYREGLGMFIGLRDIWGHTEHDIQNINIINHYIGMKPIVPAEVDVLTIMPWALAFVMGFALLTVLFTRRWLIGAWLAAFALLGAAGMYEFWSWNYDYGHNLSPDAPIKVPGMTYQPPLFGTKTLLNFRTSSYPSWGTLFIALSMLAGVHAFIGAWWRRFQPRRGDGSRAGKDLAAAPAAPQPRAAQGSRSAAQTAQAALVMLLLGGVAAGCTIGDGAPAAAGDPAADVSRPWQPAGAACDYCDGVIPDVRYGGLIETAERTYRFMSVECLAAFVASGRVAEEAMLEVLVVDFNRGDRLIDARTARYVHMQFERSPNGLNLAAAATDKLAGNLHYFMGGQRLDWAGVLALVQREWEL